LSPVGHLGKKSKRGENHHPRDQTVYQPTTKIQSFACLQHVPYSIQESASLAAPQFLWGWMRSDCHLLVIWGRKVKEVRIIIGKNKWFVNQLQKGCHLLVSNMCLT